MAVSLPRLLLFAGALACLTLSCKDEKPGPGGGASAATTTRDPWSFVGRQTCVGCHEQEHRDHHGSHHDLAMQPATPETVLGNFADATFERFGVQSKFFRKGDAFVVRTEGPDGKLADFEVSHTFGVYPLQQYLVPFPDGRRQVLSLCWDSRPKEAGGQRWYHLYDEQIKFDDPLHWTGRLQNWNFMCAHCHSTDLRKNFDLTTNTYKTSWAEIDVSCEACHGPASGHVAWAEATAKGESPDPTRNHGFHRSLRKDSNWIFAKDAVTAHRSGSGDPHVQTEACARCHSRRTTMCEGPAGATVLDTEHVVLLDDPNLYFADGQIKDEVYVYGSFVQSKMHHAGVTCTDCHNAHSLKLHAPGNALCARCHQSSTFDVPAHHHHPVGSPGAQCVRCHMPTRTYMGVDVRLDHSIRIPRPGLSARAGSPDACTQCHTDKSQDWAAEALASWQPSPAKGNADRPRPKPAFTAAVHGGRAGNPAAIPLLAQVARDPGQPAIARGTALALLRDVPDPRILETIRAGLLDAEPLARLGALQALESLGQERLEAKRLLSDPVRAVRVEAARLLAALDRSDWSKPDQERFDAALAEYIAYQELNGDQPWAHTNLGIIYVQQRQFDRAEQAYRRAIRLDENWVMAYANLADLYRELEREADCEAILRQGIAQMVDAAVLHNALGMSLSRQRRPKEALVSLRNAATLAPDAPRFCYAYALALHATGEIGSAIATLRDAHQRHPRDYDIVFALATFNRDAGQRRQAIQWAQVLTRIAPPGDQSATQLLESLQRGR